MKFLLEGPPEGGRNNAVYNAARDYMKKQYELDEAIDAITVRFHELGVFTPDFTERECINTIENAFKGEGPRITDNAPNKELERLLLQGKFIINCEDPTETTLVVESKGLVFPIHKTSVREILGSDPYLGYISTHAVHATYDYNRFSTRPLYKNSETGIWIYNSYVPPKWQKESFFFASALPAAPAAMPDIYQEFFNHLTEGATESYEYIVDWLSTAMQSRNYTILCAIGDFGIGKGVLGSIMEKLVGEKNFVKTRDEIFKNKFNGQLRNKILVYIDEVKLRTTEDHNRLKDIVNDKIEVERKGFDASYITNYASYYLSSNQLDAVRPEAGDRRFSIVELTEKKLIHTPIIERINELTSDGNIQQLALYLLSRKVSRNMAVPFYSQRSEDVKEASLTDWESYVIFDWTSNFVGKEVSIKQLQDDICEKFGKYRSPPGRRKIEELARKYPEYLKVTRPDAKSAERTIHVIASPSTNVVKIKATIKMPKV